MVSLVSVFRPFARLPESLEKDACCWGMGPCTVVPASETVLSLTALRRQGKTGTFVFFRAVYTSNFLRISANIPRPAHPTSINTRRSAFPGLFYTRDEFCWDAHQKLKSLLEKLSASALSMCRWQYLGESRAQKVDWECVLQRAPKDDRSACLCGGVRVLVLFPR